MAKIEVVGITVTVPLGRGAKYGHMDIELGRFNEYVHEYVYMYGLRQVLNDAMATKTDGDGKALSDEEIVAKATKRLENLYAGVLRSRSEGEPSDPFEAECYREAKRTIDAQLRSKGLYKDLPKGTKDKFMFVVNRLRAGMGKGEIDEAAYIVTVLAGPLGADIKKRARAAIKGRDLEVDVDTIV